MSKVLTASQLIRNWNSLLQSSASKNAIISFLSFHWHEKEFRERLGDRRLYISSHNRCILIEKNCALDYPQLASNQEEADGKLIFHAADASKDYPTVIIVANDTDVFILCLAYAHKFQSIMIKSGTSKTELHDVKNLADSLGTEVCSALIGICMLSQGVIP